MSAALVAGLATASAQTVAADSVMQHVNGKRLSVGGYGEVAMSRNFYSDHVAVTVWLTSTRMTLAMVVSIFLMQ